MILDLLEKGKINSAEADRLLLALNASSVPEEQIPVGEDINTKDKQRRAHWMHIRVSELSTGKRKFSFILPIFFIKFGISFTESRVKLADDRKSLQAGREFFKDPVKGKVVDVSDPEDNERVEISFL